MNAIEKRRAATGQSGFTLIELLVVIAILGILAAVVVFAVGNTTDRAQDEACRIERRTLVTGFEAYKGVEGSFPISADTAVASAAQMATAIDAVKASAEGSFFSGDTVGSDVGDRWHYASDGDDLILEAADPGDCAP